MILQKFLRKLPVISKNFYRAGYPFTLLTDYKYDWKLQKSQGKFKVIVLPWRSGYIILWFIGASKPESLELLMYSL